MRALPVLPALPVLLQVNAFEAADMAKRAAAMVLSLDEWMALMRALDMIGIDLTERDATLCFVWSRMVVIDGWSEAGHLRESDLPFEGFLEAICRMSTLKSLPTDEEIEEASTLDEGVTDAACYLEWLKASDETGFDRMNKERAIAWGEEPTQPIDRCIAHTLSLFFRKMELARRSKWETVRSSHGGRSGTAGRQRTGGNAAPGSSAPSAAGRIGMAPGPAPAQSKVQAAGGEGPLTEADVANWFTKTRKELINLLGIKEAHAS